MLKTFFSEKLLALKMGVAQRGFKGIYKK